MVEVVASGTEYSVVVDVTMRVLLVRGTNVTVGE